MSVRIGLVLAVLFVLWLTAGAAVVWYESGQLIEQAQQGHGDQP